MVDRLLLTANKQRTVMLIEDCEEDRLTYRRYLRTDPQYKYIYLFGRKTLAGERRDGRYKRLK